LIYFFLAGFYFFHHLEQNSVGFDALGWVGVVEYLVSENDFLSDLLESLLFSFGRLDSFFGRPILVLFLLLLLLPWSLSLEVLGSMRRNVFFLNGKLLS